MFKVLQEVEFAAGTSPVRSPICALNAAVSPGPLIEAFEVLRLGAREPNMPFVYVNKS